MVIWKYSTYNAGCELNTLMVIMQRKEFMKIIKAMLKWLKKTFWRVYFLKIFILYTNFRLLMFKLKVYHVQATCNQKNNNWINRIKKILIFISNQLTQQTLFCIVGRKILCLFWSNNLYAFLKPIPPLLKNDSIKFAFA